MKKDILITLYYNIQNGWHVISVDAFVYLMGTDGYVSTPTTIVLNSVLRREYQRGSPLVLQEW